MPGRRRRRCTRALVAGALALVVALPIPAAAQLPAPSAQPRPAAWILVDVDTGDVLDASDEHEPVLVASTIKLITALTALEHLPSDTVLTVSERAASRPAYNMGMQAGERWPVLHLLSAILLVSANDAAYVLAEGSGGSVEGFAEQMAATGERLGLRDSTFNDPAGLDDEFSFGGGSRVSAHDLAVIGRNALAVPEIAGRAALDGEELVDLRGVTRVLPTRNDVFLPLYEGATGLKTGGTSAAGNSLVASATRDGRTLLAVVLGVPGTAAWAGLLLDRGFAGYASPTGVTLPPVHVATADATHAALQNAPRLLGRPELDVRAEGTEVAGTLEASPDAAPTPTSGDEVSAAATTGTGDEAEATAPSTAATGGGLGWPVGAAAGALVLLVALALLRRRAVRRRRARRTARQRTFEEARRRGMIDVLEPGERTTGSVQVMRGRRPRSR